MSTLSSTVAQTLVDQTPLVGSEAPPKTRPHGDNVEGETDTIGPLTPDELPNIDHLVTEDDTPVDNIFSEKQQRLLSESLYASWSGPGEGRPFLVLANVGLFYSVHRPPLVPDVLLSLDVAVPTDVWAKHNRAYFVWEMGKVPEVALEIVSNRKGQEAGKKLQEYARLGIPYYVIYDPQQLIHERVLTVYELQAGTYIERADNCLEKVGLKLMQWEGVFEEKREQWLRWGDMADNLIPTGAERAEQERERAEQEQERAEQERERAEQERERAEQEQERAEQERERAERLAAQLRALGVDPEA